MIWFFKSPKNKQGVAVAIALFVLQFVYFQFQGNLNKPVVSLIPESLIQMTHVNDPLQLASLLHILVHALFSIIIVHYLYANKQSTMFVIKMSLVLIFLFGLLYTSRIFLSSDVIRIAASNLLMFLSTPFKTIFSIPALRLQPQNT